MSIYTAKNNAWQSSKRKAEVAEDLAHKILLQDGWNHVIDKRDDCIFRKMDVDFLTLSSTRTSQFIEIKSDDCEKNNNYCFEVVANTLKGTPGWGFATKCDQLWIYRPSIDTFDVLDGKKMVEWLTANHDRKNKYGKDEFYLFRNGTERREGGTLYPSLCRLVNRDLFAREVGILRRIKVSDYLTQAS